MVTWMPPSGAGVATLRFPEPFAASIFAKAGGRKVVEPIVRRYFARPAESFNTDWFGTGPLFGLLAWRAEYPQVVTLARKWLEYHLARRSVAAYTGNRGRELRAGG